ncbi:MAG: uroporphyrinogen decarboxylase family protein [Anaerolineae bacterium]
MNARQRIQAVLRGEQPDRVPRMVNFYPTEFDRHPGREAGEVFDCDIRFVEITEPEPQRSFLRYLKSLPRDVYIGSTRILKTYHDWGYHPEIPPDAPLGDARTLDEIAAAPLPDFMAQVHPERLRAAVERHHAAGYAVMAAPPHLGGELFETAYRLRGFQQFMLDLIENPPLVDYLLDQLTAMHLAVSLALVRSGIDILALDDDVGEPTRMIISPEMWRRYFKPRVQAIIEASRRANPDLAIFWHSDGCIEPIIPDLIEIGVDILNPVQPDVMDPAALKQQYGDRLTFFGTVGTPQRWAWGTPDDIRAEVRERIETVGRGGGLIISPAYDLEPQDGIPWANIEAFFEAVEEYGRY